MEIVLVHYHNIDNCLPQLTVAFKDLETADKFIKQDQIENNRKFEKYHITIIPIFKTIEEMESYFIMFKLTKE